MERRTFLQASLGASTCVTLTGLAGAQQPGIPIIDTHIHLFDVNRPQGVPWPSKDSPVLYKSALPDRYKKIAEPLGIVGAIEVEASPLLEDNQWVLDTVAKEKIIVGTVGDLEPGKPEFRKNLERFHRNPLFRGIRYGNIWNRNLGAEIVKREFVEDLKIVAAAGLELDTANPTPSLIAAIVKTTDAVPSLRVVLDHLPQLVPPLEPGARKAYYADLHELGKRPQVFAKISSVLLRVNGRVPEDLGFYQERLDELWSVFGDDRVVYGSDWPNCDQWAEYPHVLRIVQEYVAKKPRAVQEKYFWRNSIAAYKWVKRDPKQPG